MGPLTLCEVYFMSWALMLLHSAAEPIYFLQNSNLTWDDARNHCQRCFKDLVTITPSNTYDIAQNLTSDYWIGLRKSFSTAGNYTDDFTDNVTSSPDTAWTRWANGDPLAFQNWYPGWPKLKPHLPKISCCSCACTCPEATTSLSTGFASYVMPDVTTEDAVNISYLNLTDPTAASIHQPMLSAGFTSVPPTTALPVGAACVKAPVLPPVLPDPDVNYIQDSCVAMLRSGAWVERRCTDPLPFICYDDRFTGAVNVTNVKAHSAVLTWQNVPNNISYYRLLVTNATGSDVTEEEVGLNLTYNLMDLSAGSQYMVTVFAVKCDRDLQDPQNSSFYTIPNQVENLTLINQTSTSINLSWTPPDENMYVYRVQYNNTEIKTNQSGTQVTGLIPGTLYAFSVLSGVGDSSRWSEPTNISAYTMPDQVSNLQTSGRTNVSLNVTWTKPTGGFTGYNLTWSFLTESMPGFGSPYPNATNYTIGGLPPGTAINISMTVLGAGGLQGQVVTSTSFTVPSPISSLVLTANDSAINASWSNSGQVLDSFEVTLNDSIQAQNVTSTWTVFTGLNAAALYSVSVRSVIGSFRGDPVSSSTYTAPTPPSNPTVAFKNSSQITFQWEPPPNTQTVTYNISLSSSYWRQWWTFNVTNQTSYTFANLTSGTDYAFNVSTLAGHLQSISVNLIQMTDPQPVQLSLAFMCSSATPLNCNNATTLGSIFTYLNNSLKHHFHGVFWVLNNQSSENLAQ